MREPTVYKIRYRLINNTEVMSELSSDQMIRLCEAEKYKKWMNLLHMFHFFLYIISDFLQADLMAIHIMKWRPLPWWSPLLYRGEWEKRYFELKALTSFHHLSLLLEWAGFWNRIILHNGHLWSSGYFHNLDLLHGRTIPAVPASSYLLKVDELNDKRTSRKQ